MLDILKRYEFREIVGITNSSKINPDFLWFGGFAEVEADWKRFEQGLMKYREQAIVYHTHPMTGNPQPSILDIHAMVAVRQAVDFDFTFVIFSSPEAHPKNRIIQMSNFRVVYDRVWKQATIEDKYTCNPIERLLGPRAWELSFIKKWRFLP